MIDDIIENGVKKTSHRRYLKTYNIDDTIQDGTEHDYWVMDGHDTPVDKVLDNGEKINGTYAGGQRQSEKCKSVVEYGTKNPSV